MLETFFNSDLCQCYFLFFHSALKVFNSTNLILQKSNLSYTEMIRAIRKLELTYRLIGMSEFLGALTEIDLVKNDNIYQVKTSGPNAWHSNFHRISQ